MRKTIRRIIHYPAPERSGLPDNTVYYYPVVIGSDVHTQSSVWIGSKGDLALLRKGLVHCTRENALAHAQALLGGKS